MKSHQPTGYATPLITGTTRLIGILADPVSHVQTPQRLNRWFAEQGHDAVLVPMQAASADLTEIIAGMRKLRNLCGFIVTVPHKEAFALLCDELGREAAIVGAVNAAHILPSGRLLGENFDGRGFVEGLMAAGTDPRGHDILMAGAGGAARAIAFALARAGVASLAITNRDRAKATSLANSIRGHFPALDVTSEIREDAFRFSLIVNATTLGMRAGDSLPVREVFLRPGVVVAEAVMKPPRTRLLLDAERRGCRVHEGRHMLEAQVALLGNFVLAGT